MKGTVIKLTHNGSCIEVMIRVAPSTIKELKMGEVELNFKGDKK